MKKTQNASIKYAPTKGIITIYLYITLPRFCNTFLSSEIKSNFCFPGCKFATSCLKICNQLDRISRVAI